MQGSVQVRCVCACVSLYLINVSSMTPIENFLSTTVAVAVTVVATAAAPTPRCLALFAAHARVGFSSPGDGTQVQECHSLFAMLEQLERTLGKQRFVWGGGGRERNKRYRITYTRTCVRFCVRACGCVCEGGGGGWGGGLIQ